MIFLLKHNVDVNVKDSSGWTPLFCACKNGRLRICELLLQKGADASIVSNDGATALHYFVRNDYTADPVLAKKIFKVIL